MTFKQLQKQFKDHNVLEETDAKQAKKYLKSKASACWGNGGDFDGWISLASFSPKHLGDKPTKIFCKKELVKDYIK